MFWYHRPQGEHRRAGPAHPMTTSRPLRLGWPQSRAEPGLASQVLTLERDSGLRQASPCGKPELVGSRPARWAQFEGTAAALFVGGDGEASLAFFVFFFRFFFLVPGGAWSPLSWADSFSCLPTAALLVAVAATSALSSFLAFFFNFRFFFFSTETWPWMADSWRMSEADTAASRQRRNSSSPSSLLPGRVGGVLVGLGTGPQRRRACPRPGHQTEARERRRYVENSGLAGGQTWVPTQASLLPGCVTSFRDLTSPTLRVFTYQVGILTEPRLHRDVPGVCVRHEIGAPRAVNI